MSLKDKKIILGICGSIAAYKAAMLTRLLVKAGADVQVIMTPEATKFISPLTLATLSGKSVLTKYSDDESGVWNNHVHLGLWADLLLIAPATANTLAKLAQGHCDNLLSAVYLSARCPVFIAPAMDLDMWAHPATQNNVSLLQHYGNILISPREGDLASGLIGHGRLAEPEEIISLLQEQIRHSTGFASHNSSFKGKRVLLTAGPTYEALDPVRFIGNHSSGKMGYALAEKLLNLGAIVTLISGPTHLAIPLGAQCTKVQRADEMLLACKDHFPACDIAIMCAAVADYTPKTVAKRKIKKSNDELTIELKKTTDIAATLGRMKKKHQLLVGFALETDDEIKNALAKLKRKNLDLIVLNSLNDAGAGFTGDQNKITILDKNEQAKVFPLKSKKEVAHDIIQHIATLIQ